MFQQQQLLLTRFLTPFSRFPSLHSLHCKHRLHSLSSSPTMSTSSPPPLPPPSTSTSPPSTKPSVMILSGKSNLEIQHAQSMIQNNKLVLPEDDIRVPVVVRDGEVVEGKFDVGLYMSKLTTEKFGRFLMWGNRLSSTQDVIAKNFCELPIGAVCVADIQFKGRGRLKNVWESPIGCLLFSFTLQMEDGRIVPLLQYVVSLAVTEAIKDVCHANGLPYLDIRIKWPNDLYLIGLKVGGVLCTSTYRAKKFNVSIGIGLNVDNEKPSTCLNTVLQHLHSVAYKLRREEILAAFFKKFENLFNVFLTQGFQALEETYCHTWLHSGQKVVIKEEIEGQLDKEVAVTIQGLTSSGYLLAIGEDNELYELHPDGNSLDFFNGLVRRKL